MVGISGVILLYGYYNILPSCDAVVIMSGNVVASLSSGDADVISTTDTINIVVASSGDLDMVAALSSGDVDVISYDVYNSTGCLGRLRNINGGLKM